MILISSAILGVVLLVPPQAQDQRAAAERLAGSGAYADALKQFQTIAAANPDDIDARLWIARLHAKLGHPEHAVDVYRSILAVQPQHVDALIGAGESLVALDRLSEASELLRQAEALAPDRPAVLAAQGRLHHAANHTTLSLAYYNRALALDPSNAQIRTEADEVRAERAHRLELDYDFQHVNSGQDDSHLGSFVLNARTTDSVRVVAQGQTEDFYGVSDQRAGGGFDFTLSRKVNLNFGALFGFDPVYLPQTDVYGELTYRDRRLTLGGVVRRAGFEDDSDVLLIGPEVMVKLSDSAEASIRYLRGHTNSSDGFTEISTDTVAIGLSGAISKQVRLGAAYTHGIDRLDWLTSDRIGFESDTVAFRANLFFSPFVSLEVGYDFQSRPDDIQVHRARAGLTYRF
jgi:YaiO family outer membrane protein